MAAGAGDLISTFLGIKMGFDSQSWYQLGIGGVRAGGWDYEAIHDRYVVMTLAEVLCRWTQG